MRTRFQRGTSTEQEDNRGQEPSQVANINSDQQTSCRGRFTPRERASIGTCDTHAHTRKQGERERESEHERTDAADSTTASLWDRTAQALPTRHSACLTTTVVAARCGEKASTTRDELRSVVNSRKLQCRIENTGTTSIPKTSRLLSRSRRVSRRQYISDTSFMIWLRHLSATAQAKRWGRHSVKTSFQHINCASPSLSSFSRTLVAFAFTTTNRDLPTPLPWTRTLVPVAAAVGVPEAFSCPPVCSRSIASVSTLQSTPAATSSMVLADQFDFAQGSSLGYSHSCTYGNNIACHRRSARMSTITTMARKSGGDGDSDGNDAAASNDRPLALTHTMAVSSSESSLAFLRHFRDQLESNREDAYAAKMQSYLKTTNPMYGIKSQPRREMLKRSLAQHPITTSKDYAFIVHELWTNPLGGREEMYAAVDIAGYASREAKLFRTFATPDMLPLVSHMVHTADWWDTLDPVAMLVGRMLLEHRDDVEPYLIEWRTNPSSKWVRRASLLAHLKHGKRVNLALFEETLIMLLPERDFFIEKAVGWALRDYARFEPHWVQQFVREHKYGMASLSKREALKHVGEG